MPDYKDLRSGHPLRPADIGKINGYIVGVWHNWDRITVKSTDGTELLSWESSEGLIHQARLINHRYLCIALGADISVYCVKFYDFVQKSWLEKKSLGSGSVECALLSAHPTSSLLFLNTCLTTNTEHAEVWDINHPTARWPIAMNWGFNCADFIDTNSLIACNFQGIFQINQDGSYQVLYHSDDISLLHQQAEITAIKWQPLDQTILIGDASGTLSLLTDGDPKGMILGKFSDEIVRIDCYGSDLIAISTYDNCVHLLNINDTKQKTLPDAFGLQISPVNFFTLSASTTTLHEVRP